MREEAELTLQLCMDLLKMLSHLIKQITTLQLGQERKQKLTFSLNLLCKVPGKQREGGFWKV